MKIVELLGLSLGISRECFKNFYEDNDSILRLNYYPTCDKPELVLGTGPHSDPTSITILHQDHVSGLQVFVDDQWYSIPPTPDSFVINIGDTFMVCICNTKLELVFRSPPPRSMILSTLNINSHDFALSFLKSFMPIEIYSNSLLIDS